MALTMLSSNNIHNGLKKNGREKIKVDYFDEYIISSFFFFISSCVKSPRSIPWHWLFWNKLRCIRDNLDCHFANVQCCVFQKYFSHRPFNWEAKVQIAVIQIRLCIFDFGMCIFSMALIELNAQLPKLLMRTACLI